VTIHDKRKFYIDGAWVEPLEPNDFEVLNPATERAIATISMGSVDDVDLAVEAARRAFPSFSKTSKQERKELLQRILEVYRKRYDEMVEIISLELGAPVSMSKNSQAAVGVGHLEGFLEAFDELTLRQEMANGDTLIREPVGVCGLITPWNWPVNQIALKVLPAIAVGCTVVLKPSEQDPLTHQMIVDLAAEAGLPPGVLNVVHGAHETVTAILEHPGIEGVSFVGSSRVARLVYAGAAATGKRVQALGGAKNHMIVLPDADMDATNEALIGSLYGSAGQRCLAGSIIVGVAGAYDDIRERFLDATASLVVGNGIDDGVQMGPVISAPHRQRIVDYIDGGEDGGAELVVDGRDAVVAGHPDGHWVGPTVFEKVSPAMKLGSDEVFGPVAGFTRAADIDEAINLMHQVEYGNATSIFTTNGKSAREFRHRAGISMIGVNVGVAAPMAFFPFGGARGSFYGDLKAAGADAISFYTDRRVVIERW